MEFLNKFNKSHYYLYIDNIRKQYENNQTKCIKLLDNLINRQQIDTNYINKIKQNNEEFTKIINQNKSENNSL